MATENRTLLSLVLPVFNEEASIPPLVERLGKLRERLADVDVEVIFVDDHSTDHTPALLKDLCRQDPRARYYRLARNSGSHIATLAGLEQSRGDCAVLLAADLQDPPELIPELLREWRAGSSVVWAVRTKREALPFVDRIAARLFYWLMNRFSNVTLPPKGSDFALLDRSVIAALMASVSSTPNLVGEIARLGFSQTHIPYTKKARQYGKSKWTLGMKITAAVDAMVSFSYVPVRLMVYVGLLITVISFLYIVLIVILRITVDRHIEGWASMMVVILGLGGLQMTMLGLLGEYLWRNLEESRKRPLYFFEDRSDSDRESP